MSNQKAINVEKFEGIMWRNAGRFFKAHKDVQRKPFGDFTVDFEMNANTGETEMQVRSWRFEELNSEKRAYKTFNKAVNAVIEYFEEIDRFAKKVPNTAKYEAEKAYQTVIVKELIKIKENAV